jgi:hypothetical protein
MAKKNWQDNDHITPAYLNSFFGVDGSTGHIHDGDDADFSAPKVVLTGGNNVSGELPMYYLEGYDYGNIGVKITTTYLTVEQTANIFWQKVGGFVYVHIPEMIGVSNSIELRVEIQTGNWPDNFQPGGIKRVEQGVTLFDNGNELPGTLTLYNGGSSHMIFNVLSSGIYSHNGFTGSGNKGIPRTTLFWGKEEDP